MNKTDLIAAVAKSHADLPYAQVNRVVNTLLDTISLEMRRGRTVQVTGFGSFSVIKRKARKGRNPKTGEPIRIAATVVPKFSAGRGLKDLVNKRK